MDLLELKSRQTTNRHPWELARLEIVKKIINTHSQTKKFNSINLYDIGCGDTFVLEQLMDYFKFNYCYGVDIEFSSDDLTTLNQKLNSKKISIFKNIVNIPSSEQDILKIVLLLDVVEHIEDDYSFMKMLSEHSLFSTNTVFIITVPAYQKLFTSHDIFLKHYRRYTVKTLKKLLNKNDFKIIKNGYFFSSLLIPRVLSLLKEAIFSRKEIPNTKLGIWNGSRKTTQFIKRVLLLDYFISSKISKIFNFPGLSTYAVCKKQV